MKIKVTESFIKSLKRINSPWNKIRGVWYWIYDHTRKDFFRVLKATLSGNPWDSFYLLRMEKAKLIELANYLEKTNRYVGVEYDVRNIRICISLLEIMLDERELSHTTGDWRVDKDGALDMSGVEYHVDVYVNTKNIDRIIPDKTAQSSYLKFPDLLYVEKARHLYHKIRNEQETRWAD